YLSFENPLWWDSHVYISMGKYMFSHREMGFWESFRPFLHPVILGFFWRIGFDPAIIGTVLDIVFSLTAIGLVYIITRKIFNRSIAALAALIFSLTPFFIIFTGILLADPLALTLGLLGILFLLPQAHQAPLPLRYFFSGLCLALSFLTRFPQGIWFVMGGLYVFLHHQHWKAKVQHLTAYSGGFLLPVIPYLIFNYITYNNALEPFTAGSWIVTTATWMYGSGTSFYLTHFFLTNPLFLFFFIYIFFVIKEKLWKSNAHILTLVIIVCTLIYFLTVPRKEVRYLATALPFLAISVGYTLVTIYHKLTQSKKPLVTPRFFIVLCLLLLLLPMPSQIYLERPPQFTNDIKNAVNALTALNSAVNSTTLILASNPEYISFLDQKTETLDGLDYAPTIYKQNAGKYPLLIINDCDFPCAPDDALCQEKKQQFLDLVAEENKEIFKKEYVFRKQTCIFKILTPQHGS
ncbi:MAG: glycosyltransferase family 39 protein, partial [Nanoarchaeota archaeon]